jgi:hypothetical protein
VSNYVDEGGVEGAPSVEPCRRKGRQGSPLCRTMSTKREWREPLVSNHVDEKVDEEAPCARDSSS